MSEGLFEDITNGKEDEGGDQEAGAELPLATLKRPVRAEDRKTHQQRRKEKLRREEERRRKVEKLEKARAQAIYRLRSVRREMREKEEKMMENIRKRQEEKAKAMCSTKRLGRYSYLFSLSFSFNPYHVLQFFLLAHCYFKYDCYGFGFNFSQAIRSLTLMCS